MQCKDCKYFLIFATDESMGDCHRYPPRFESENNIDSFPLVTNNEWCGEFKPKNETKHDVEISEDTKISVSQAAVIMRSKGLQGYAREYEIKRRIHLGYISAKTDKDGDFYFTYDDIEMLERYFMAIKMREYGGPRKMQALSLFRKHGNMTEVAKIMNISANVVEQYVRMAEKYEILRIKYHD